MRKGLRNLVLAQVFVVCLTLVGTATVMFDVAWLVLGVGLTGVVGAPFAMMLIERKDRRQAVLDKYRPLGRHLQRVSENGEWTARLSLVAIESIIGTELPDAARECEEWWANDPSHLQARAWLGGGWVVVGTTDLGTLKATITFRLDNL